MDNHEIEKERNELDELEAFLLSEACDETENWTLDFEEQADEASLHKEGNTHTENDEVKKEAQKEKEIEVNRSEENTLNIVEKDQDLFEMDELSLEELMGLEQKSFHEKVSGKRSRLVASIDQRKDIFVDKVKNTDGLTDGMNIKKNKHSGFEKMNHFSEQAHKGHKTKMRNEYKKSYEQRSSLFDSRTATHDKVSIESCRKVVQTVQSLVFEKRTISKKYDRVDNLQDTRKKRRGEM